MHELNFFDQFLKLNDCGIIVATSFCNNMVSDQHPIYPVLFTEYSRLNPSCKHFDINIPITDVVTGNDWMSFRKQIGLYPTFFHIRIYSNGFDINLSVEQQPSASLRFGIAHPFGYSSETFCFNEKLRTPLSFYCYLFHHIFSDQTLINTPMVTLKDSNSLSVYTSLKTNCQFFTYNDKDVKYVRATSCTSTNSSGCFSFRYHSNSMSTKSIYLNSYPSADRHLNEWKRKIDEVNEKYGINIIYQHNKDFKQRIGNMILTAENPKADQAEKFSDILLNELAKYNAEAFKKLDIKLVYICSNLKKHELFGEHAFVAHGYAQTSAHMQYCMFLNADAIGSKLIHHEIYHFFAKKENIENTEAKAEEFAEFMTSSNKNEVLFKKFEHILEHKGVIKKDTRLPFRNIDIAFKTENGEEKIPFGKYPPKYATEVTCEQ